MRRFDYLVEAVARAGARKLLFGSDEPWLHPGPELHKIRLLHLSSNEQALVLGGNTERLLFQKSLGPERPFKNRPSRITASR